MWTLDATTRSILSMVPRTGLDCLTASKISYSKNRTWNPVLCSQLMSKLTVDFKSFCLFLLVSMTDLYSNKESEHESSLHCCITIKLVYKQVFSPVQFCFLLSLRNNEFTCLAFLFLFLVSFLCFVSSLSSLVLVTNTTPLLLFPLYLHKRCLSGLPSI